MSTLDISGYTRYPHLYPKRAYDKKTEEEVAFKIKLIPNRNGGRFGGSHEYVVIQPSAGTIITYSRKDFLKKFKIAEKEQ